MQTFAVLVKCLDYWWAKDSIAGNSPMKRILTILTLSVGAALAAAAASAGCGGQLAGGPDPYCRTYSGPVQMHGSVTPSQVPHGYTTKDLNTGAYRDVQAWPATECGRPYQGRRVLNPGAPCPGTSTTGHHKTYSHRSGTTYRHTTPAPRYHAPKPVVRHTPKPVYHAPKSVVHAAPRTHYKPAPVQTYRPAPTYHRPAAPAPRYHAPKPVVHKPHAYVPHSKPLVVHGHCPGKTIKRIKSTRDGRPRYKVCYADLAPLDTYSVSKLYERIETAARRACRGHSVWAARRGDRECRKEAVFNAVQDVNSPKLYDFYLSKTSRHKGRHVPHVIVGDPIYH